MNKSNEYYSKRINAVIDYVSSNLDRSISLNELAAKSFFSPYHFHRIFMAVTGESVNNFTNRMRLEKAVKFLKFSDKAILAIAYECGFSSPSTLSRTFKNYFGVSPSAYRKSGKILNSKIRKDLFPVSNYHCDMTEEELIKTFPIKIQDFPARRIVYIRVTDSFKEGVVLNVFGELVRWAKKVNLFDSEVIFGMSKDDPMITPQEKYIYDVCISIPENFEINSDFELEIMTMPASKYAVVTVDGDFNKVATATNFMFNHWLINSPFEPKHQPGLEIFRDKEKVCDWSYFNLDLCIPIKEIKN